MFHHLGDAAQFIHLASAGVAAVHRIPRRRRERGRREKMSFGSVKDRRPALLYGISQAVSMLLKNPLTKNESRQNLEAS